jgi:tRNA1(Val) A37 N6-methylase TrmN6
MSISQINIKEFKQNFTVSKEDKLKYGEIYTPFSLIDQMLNLFDPKVFLNKDAKWLDPGAGTGYFSIYLFHKLFEGLKPVFPDAEERKSHIIENMLYMVEIKESNILILREQFGDKANIFHMDFLVYQPTIQFDFVIGNPPYNTNGLKKVPTNTQRNKKNEEGQTIWISFVKYSLTLLKTLTGQLCVIVPAIWMKPDKARMYQYLMTYKIEKIHCLTNTETNKIFNGNAQTPTCFFLLTKCADLEHYIDLYDLKNQKYIPYYCQPSYPIPLFGAAILNKIQPFIARAGSLAATVLKTNMPPLSAKFSPTYIFPYVYPNIKTCLLKDDDGLTPELVVNYSLSPQVYYEKKKLVLAHKMYGFPFLDTAGKYGISNRDNYVILKNNTTELCQLKDFLSTKFVLYIYEATRYRMKYLEKYAFQFLPDICNLPDFPIEITDESVATYFGLEETDKDHINHFHKKNYGRFA